MTSSSTSTFAGVVRVMGGGTIGGSVSTAFSSGSAARHSDSDRAAKVMAARFFVNAGSTSGLQG
jgi:hypothetical protein